MAKKHAKPARAEAIPAAAATGAILRLVAGRPAMPLGMVSVSGQLYEMADAAHFSLRELGRYLSAQGRILALEESALAGKSTDDDELEYRKRLTDLAAVMVPSAPTTVWTEISTGELGDLAVAFFGLAATRNPRLQMVAAMVAARNRLNGTKSSPSSRTSTRRPRAAAATGSTSR